jgi:hypothetical protein
MLPGPKMRARSSLSKEGDLFQCKDSKETLGFMIKGAIYSFVTSRFF